MNKSKEMLFSSLIFRNAKCKYTKTCNLYSNASYTCTHTGGSYCGKYRKLSLSKATQRLQTTTPYLIETIQTP